MTHIIIAKAVEVVSTTHPLENVVLASDAVPSCPKCRALAALECGEGKEWKCRVCDETVEG